MKVCLANRTLLLRLKVAFCHCSVGFNDWHCQRLLRKQEKTHINLRLNVFHYIGEPVIRYPHQLWESKGVTFMTILGVNVRDDLSTFTHITDVLATYSYPIYPKITWPP